MQQKIRTFKGRQTTYTVGQLLGEGQFGKVYRGYPSSKAKTVALKIIRKSKLSKNQKLRLLLERQIEILTQFNHQNVIKFIQFISEKQEICLVYEQCQGGTLEDRITLSQEQFLPYLSQIIDALTFAQQRGIIHRDIKPANILFKNGKIKVADWGFSRLLTDGQTTCSFIGSPAYMAPEILQNRQYTITADIWSLGIVIYETLFGCCPWKSNSINSLYHQIVKHSVDFPRTVKISSFMKGLICETLSVESIKRPSFRQIRHRLNCFLDKRGTIWTNLINEQQYRIMSCVFFLQFVQWVRKNITNTDRLLNFIDLILKNLLKLKIYNKKQEQVNKVLQKQIKVVNQMKKKLQKKISTSKKYSIDQSKLTQSMGTSENPESDWQQLVKETIKQAMKKLEIIYLQSPSNKQAQLLQLNLLLDLLIFSNMPKDYLKSSFSDYLTELKSSNKKILLKLINFKLQAINKRYYH